MIRVNSKKLLIFLLKLVKIPVLLQGFMTLLIDSWKIKVYFRSYRFFIANLTLWCFIAYWQLGRAFQRPIFFILKPSEKRDWSFIIIQCFCKFPFIEIFIASFSKLFISHEPWTALKASYFFEIFTIIEKSMFQVNGKLIKFLSNYRCWLPSSSNIWEIDLIGRKIKFELWNKGLVKSSITIDS